MYARKQRLQLCVLCGCNIGIDSQSSPYNHSARTHPQSLIDLIHLLLILFLAFCACPTSEEIAPNYPYWICVSKPIKKMFCSRLITCIRVLPSLPTSAEHGYIAPYFPLSSLEIAGGRYLSLKLANKGGQEWAQTKRQQISMVIFPFFVRWCQLMEALHCKQVIDLAMMSLTKLSLAKDI